jgi:hypothetical protein
MARMLIRSSLIKTLVVANLMWAASGQDVSKSAGANDNLGRYTSCHFGYKTTVEEAIENTQSFLRPVDTALGRKNVTVVHGFSLHLAYDGTPFINFKAEHLGRQGYAGDKQILIDSLRHAAANTREMEAPEPKKTELNGLEVYSIDRKQLAGGVLGIYLLFRDADQTVVTLYFLNTPPEDPKFQNVKQAHDLRDAFLKVYSTCVRDNLGR